MRWVIVVLIQTGILWLDQNKFRKFIRLEMGHVLKEPVDLMVIQEIVEFSLMGENQGTRKIVEVNLPGLSGLVKTIKKRGLMLAKNKIVQIRILKTRHLDAS